MMAAAVLIVHTMFVLFVVTGLALVLVGGACKWRWVRNPWFRTLHLAAIVFVAAESWLGVVCPLTTLEMSLRERSDGGVYSEGFIAHWLRMLLYYEAPGWVFTVAYTLFAVCVVASWVAVRPRRFTVRLDPPSSSKAAREAGLATHR
jgi:hypothetical protein